VSQTCDQCGAPVNGLVYEYCGVVATNLSGANTELAALDEFHNILLTKDDDARIKLLQHGFLPKSAGGLIDAAVRCIPIIKSDQPNDDMTVAAAARLDAIVAKIKFMPELRKNSRLSPNLKRC
jgi:hypothetical protein